MQGFLDLNNSGPLFSYPFFIFFKHQSDIFGIAPQYRFIHVGETGPLSPSYITPVDPEPEDDEESSDLEVESEEGKNLVARSRAEQERKKAGLPELEVDALASTIATRMMSLWKFQGIRF